MRNIYKERTGTPLFLGIAFFAQFAFFLIYTINNPDDKSLIYFSIGILLLGLFIIFSKLELIINEDYIRFGFTPFPKKNNLWTHIENVEIVKLSKLAAFSGWGIKYSKKMGWGYLTEKDYVLIVHKKNGKKNTVSIRDKEKLIDYLQSIDKYPLPNNV